MKKDHKKKDFSRDGINYEVWYAVTPNRNNGERDPRFQEVIKDGFVDIEDVHVHDDSLLIGEDRKPTIEELQWLVKQVEKVEMLVVG
jgi:hypothetical protein